MAKPVLPAYEKDGSSIYAQSFAIIRREADLSRFDGVLERAAVRMIHACGMTDIAADICASPGAAEAGRAALRRGAPVFCDARMVAHGITRARLPAANRVISMLDAPDLAARAARANTTRSAAALDFYREALGGAVIAIGNAPTALFRLLEMLAEGAPKPALILGLPVGFVGAAEAKRALAARPHAAPFITLRGRRGGSAVCAAAVNALAQDREI